MRRVITALIAALVLAVLVGRFSASSGLRVNGQVASAAQVRGELTAIANSTALQCYLTAIDPASYGAGAGTSTMAASGAAAWSDLRIQAMAINQYVSSSLHYQPGVNLAKATGSLESEMTQAAAADSFTCPGSASAALAAMTPAMRSLEVTAQADSLYLVSRLNSTIPLTTASLHAYYAHHRSQYVKICVSVALVPVAKVSAFARAQAAGASVATLAQRFSLDPSGARGGSYGCYGPSSPYYASVRADVAGHAVGHFPTTPSSTTQNGTTYALYVAATSERPATFAASAARVLSDVRSLNAVGADQVRSRVVDQATVAVDPALGQWVLGSNGLTVSAPSVPAASAVTGASVLGSPSALTYR
ncbi:MAG: hypothetical protein ACP5OV_01740 [Acidimicrobiales bacterium]